jgi:regulator of protease activity HflC (stomatin/prohibitin superfamily)
MIREIPRKPLAGIPMLVALPLAILGTVLLMVLAFTAQQIVLGIALLLVVIVEAVMLGGFFMVAPNEAQVLQLFGRYVGTAREPGLRWANPFYGKRKVSVRVRNFETPKLKVNDNHSNPIEIAAVVVWRVVDTAEAMFEVDDYKNYVGVQSESALRSLATGYPYDAHDTGQLSLSGNTAEVSEKLKSEIQERLGKAGVEVIEARISHLAYAQEIAAAMLQRQQASAIVAARYKIVEGAVGMVEMALEMLAKGKIVELDDERKAAMVSNLLVVLCSDRHAQPVVNTGTLHN